MCTDTLTRPQTTATPAALPGTGRTVLLLGGYGNAGRALGESALQWLGVDLIVAGRNSRRVWARTEELKARFGAARVRALELDAEDDRGIARALAGVDLVLVAASVPGRLEQIARQAIAAGIDYVDLWFSPEKSARMAALDTTARRAGCVLLTQSGQHPGLPAAMLRRLAADFDTVESALVGSYVRANWGELQFSEATAAEFDEPFLPLLYQDGVWLGLTEAALEAGIPFDFGAGPGVRNCWPVYLAELEAFINRHPGLREAGFLLEQGYGSPMPPPYFALLRAEVIGRVKGETRARALEVLHADGFQLTALSVIACLIQYFQRRRRPGYRIAGAWVHPHRFFNDLARMGVGVRLG